MASPSGLAERTRALQEAGGRLLERVARLAALPEPVDAPKLARALRAAFPRHPREASAALEKADKPALVVFRVQASSAVEALEPWVGVVHDVAKFYMPARTALIALVEACPVGVLSRSSVLCDSFMGLLCTLTKLLLLLNEARVPLMLQAYALAQDMCRPGTDPEDWSQLAQFVDKYSPPVPRLQADLNLLSFTMSDVLMSVVLPAYDMIDNTAQLRAQGALTPFSPVTKRRRLDLAKLARVSEYNEWAVIGLLLMPGLLNNPALVKLALLSLEDNPLLCLHHDVCLWTASLYMDHVHERIIQIAKVVKKEGKNVQGTPAQTFKKALKYLIENAHAGSMINTPRKHANRRTWLAYELQTLVQYLEDQPSRLPVLLPVVLAALSLGRHEVLWFMRLYGEQPPKGITPGAQQHQLNQRYLQFDGFAALLMGLTRLGTLAAQHAPAVGVYAASRLAVVAQELGEGVLDAPPLAEFVRRVQHGIAAPDLEQDTVMQWSETLLAMCAEDVDPQVQGMLNNVVEMSSLDTVSVARSQSSGNALELSGPSSSGADALTSSDTGAAVLEYVLESLDSFALEARLVRDPAAVVSRACSLAPLCFSEQKMGALLQRVLAGDPAEAPAVFALLRIYSTYVQNGASYAIVAVKAAEETTNATVNRTLELGDMLDTALLALEQQLAPNRAAARMRTEGAGALSAKKRKSMSLFGAAQAASAHPLPGYESHHANRSNLNSMERTRRVLLALCRGLKEADVIEITPGRMLVPRERLRESMRVTLKTRIQNATKRQDGQVQAPSVLKAQIGRYLQVARMMAHAAGFDAEVLMRDIMLGEVYTKAICTGLTLPPGAALPPSPAGSGTIASGMADWYVRTLVRGMQEPGVVYSPAARVFVSSQPSLPPMPGSPLGLSSVREMDALVELLGPYVVHAIEDSLEHVMLESMRSIEALLRQNSHVLADIAVSTSDQPALDAALRKLEDLDIVAAQAITLGRCLALQRMALLAVRRALGERCPAALDYVEHLIGQTPSVDHRTSLFPLWVTAHVSGALPEGERHDVANPLVAKVFSSLSTARDQGWRHLPALVAAAIMWRREWAVEKWSVEAGATTDNMHCVVDALQAVLLAAERVGAVWERDAQQQQKQQQPGERRASPPPPPPPLRARAALAKFAEVAGAVMRLRWRQERDVEPARRDKAEVMATDALRLRLALVERCAAGDSPAPLDRKALETAVPPALLALSERMQAVGVRR